MLAGRWGAPLGPRGCLLLNTGVLAATMAAVGTWSTYPVLFAAAAAGGLGYAFGNVGTTMAVVLAAPARRVGLGLTVRTAGIPVVASALAFGAGASTGGWQWLPWSLCGGSVVLALATLAVLPPVRTSGSAGAPRREGPLPAGFWRLPLAAGLFIGGSQPLLSWTVVYLHDAGGVATSLAGPLVASGTLLGTVVMLVVARVGDVVGAARRGTLIAIVSVAAAVGVAMTALGTQWWLPLGLGGVAVGIGANLAGAGLSHVVAADRSAGAIGRGSGRMLFGYYAGALVSPIVFGLLAERTDGYLLPWALCTLLMLLAALVFWRTHVVLPAGDPDGALPQTQQTLGVGREPRQQAADMVDGRGA